MDTLLLEEMTWPEIRDALQNGMRTVVVCAASIEQHGPHLPFETDAARHRRVHAGETVDQCRLAGVVGAEQPDDFAGAQRQRDIVQNRHAAITGHQMIDLKHRDALRNRRR